MHSPGIAGVAGSSAAAWIEEYGSEEVELICNEEKPECPKQ